MNICIDGKQTEFVVIDITDITDITEEEEETK
jgi:hypothetical protein